MGRELRKYQTVEQSINKKFNKRIWRPFITALKQYELIQAGDRIAVCMSGGKDSFLLAVLMRMLQKQSEVPFELVYLVMDPGYNEKNRRKIEENASLLELPITVFQSDIFDVTASVGGSPCYLCARMRRGHLYRRAQELGCNKIALGHHYDDVIETILMGMLWSGQFQTMMPKVNSQNFEGMELIRPMYLIREEDIIRWKDFHGLSFLQCACHFTETCWTVREDGTAVSKRKETKQLIAELKKTNPYVESNLFQSVTNVSLKTVIAYKDQNGVRHHFLEEYDGERRGI